MLSAPGRFLATQIAYLLAGCPVSTAVLLLEACRATVAQPSSFTKFCFNLYWPCSSCNLTESSCATGASVTSKGQSCTAFCSALSVLATHKRVPSLPSGPVLHETHGAAIGGGQSVKAGVRTWELHARVGHPVPDPGHTLDSKTLDAACLPPLSPRHRLATPAASTGMPPQRRAEDASRGLEAAAEALRGCISLTAELQSRGRRAPQEPDPQAAFSRLLCCLGMCDGASTALAKARASPFPLSCSPPAALSACLH